MDHSVSTNVHNSRGTKQTMCASADKEVDPLRGRIGGESVEQSGPRKRRRIADETDRVRLKACHPATRAYEGYHFADDAFRLRYVDQNEAHMGTVERRSRQSSVIRITLANLDLPQRVIRDEAARQAGKMRVRSIPRTEPVGPTRLPRRCRTPPVPQPRSRMRSPALIPIFSNCASESGARSAIWRLRRASSASP